MKDYMISMFIDDELDLDEKIELVETVHADTTMKNEIISLLHHEKLLRSPVVDRSPVVEVAVQPKRTFFLWRSAAAFVSGLAAALIIVFFVLPEQRISSVPYRFVIYEPDVNQVDIAGSFTEWKSLPMKKMGTTGYWEITLDLQEGEHRYNYILESGVQIPDPSVLARERDDFGGENSILDVNIDV
jgi:hypothetical protein